MTIVFALGSNGSGQLGIGHCEDVSVPKQSLWEDSASTVVSIVAGGNHTLLLSGTGNLYWAGDPCSGACGSVSSNNQKSLQFSKMRMGRPGEFLPAQGRVQMATATWEASIFTALDENGRNTKVFSCGLGERGELGQGPLVVRDPYATQLKDFPPIGTEIVCLSSCITHVVAVLSNGEAYGWGNGRKGQLGSPNMTIFSPRKIDVGFFVTRAVCGKEFTCFLGGEGGKILVLGQDKWNIISKAPSKIPGWKDMRAGWSNIFILEDNGGIQTWGRDDYGLQNPPSPQKTLKMAMGSEHAIALLDNGDVLSWGWGEHGNCGPARQEEATKGQRNVIASSRFLPPDTRISAVYAGCATSWIVIEDASKGDEE